MPANLCLSMNFAVAMQSSSDTQTIAFPVPASAHELMSTRTPKGEFRIRDLDGLGHTKYLLKSYPHDRLAGLRIL